MKFIIISLFPSIFDGVFDTSMMLKAKKLGLLEVDFINLRDFGLGPNTQVDDQPYGGGDGMVLMIEPLVNAVEKAKEQLLNAKVLLMTPRGDKFNQQKAMEMADHSEYIIICGRYEGYDERITEFVDNELSIGEYVLTGGEIPAMVLVDSLTRLVPGVLGGDSSAEKESHTVEGVIEHPHYTRPEDFRGMKVPDVLLSGHHANVENWRESNSESQAS